MSENKKKLPWVKILVDTYTKCGIPKGRICQTYQVYPSGNVEVGSAYGLRMIKKEEYEIVPPSLQMYLEDAQVDAIVDDADWMEAEYNAIHEYCELNDYDISDEDMEIIKGRGLEESFECWMEERK